MKRRQFLKGTAGLAAGIMFRPLWAAEQGRPDLVGVMGGEPGPMFDQGMAALGGIREFVKPNQTVAIKPNIGWDKEPDMAANTHPDLVKRIVAQCRDAGARKVYVFDHTCDSPKQCYVSSGISQAVRDAGGIMVPGNARANYGKIEIPRGKILTKALAHELFVEPDVFINVPVLKDHSSTRLTIGMKNLMGVVWNRGWWHFSGLHQCIADFSTFRKPDLTVVDAYRVLKRNGPRGVSPDDTVLMKSLILSTDPVAADAAGAKLFGVDPGEIAYIRQAHDMGTGTMDLSGLNIQRIRV